MSGMYKFGDKAEGIRILQQALADNGFNPGPVDSVYGPATLNAINDARAAYKLDGINRVDADLLRFLGILPKPRASNPLQDWLLSLAIKQGASFLKGLPIMNFLSGYKTYATVVVIIVMSIYSLVFGELPLVGLSVDPGSAVMALLSSLGLGFARSGAKSDVKKIG